MSGKIKVLLGLLASVAAGVVVMFGAEKPNEPQKENRWVEYLKEKYRKAFDGNETLMLDRPEAASLFQQLSRSA